MSVEHFAHNLSSKSRTEDVFINLEIDFEGMPISENILKGLEACRYKRPSPIQFKAVPLGKCGFDLIVQSKSGTGKTLVFGIVALEMLQEINRNVQVLILTPTREIAVQIYDVLIAIGSYIKDLSVKYFIGGLPIEDDIKNLKNCQIAIGAPGRIKHLIESGNLKLNNIKLFILDEADQLMHSSFETDVDYIFNKLPKDKQVVAASATYPDSLDEFTSKYMRSPIHVHPGDDIPVLLGLKQFISIVPSHNNIIKQMQIKTDELTRIISTVPFKQCLVFFNYQTRAESISNKLNQLGWPTLFITGKQDQKQRLATIKNLKEFKFRVLLSTDLTARGIDVENVNLVINYDVPYNGATYLHRIGRSGRYGSLGISISIVGDKKESEDFKNMLTTISGNEFSLLKFPNKESMPDDIWNCDIDKFETFTNKDTGNLNGENKQNNHKMVEYKNVSENCKIDNVSEQSCLLNTTSSSTHNCNGVFIDNNCISKNEIHNSEDNIENNEVIKKTECISIISNTTSSENNDNSKEIEQNEVLIQNSVQLNFEEKPLVSNILDLSGLMEKKSRPKFNSFDSNCHSFLMKKENRNEECIENLTEFEDKKLLDMSKQTFNTNQSNNTLKDDMNDSSLCTINSQYEKYQFLLNSENKLNINDIDVSLKQQTEMQTFINNSDIQNEIKKHNHSVLDNFEKEKCNVENTEGCISLNHKNISESNFCILVNKDFESLNTNRNLITKNDEEQSELKKEMRNSIAEDKLKSNHIEIDIRNTEYGVPMLPDLSTTPQAIREEKEKHKIYLRNKSLLELSKVMIKEQNLDFKSFDSYCKSFLNKELSNKLVREETSISENACSSVDHLLKLIKEEINIIYSNVKSKFQDLHYKSILKQLSLKENLLNEIYMNENRNEISTKQLCSTSKHLSEEPDNRLNENISNIKELKYSKSYKNKSALKNTKNPYDLTHNSQHESQSNYLQESEDNYIHNEYSRNPEFLSYDSNNIDQHYYDNSRNYNFNYNTNKDHNSDSNIDDWYDMWRRQVFHIKQYVRNTIYLREMININNYY